MNIGQKDVSEMLTTLGPDATADWILTHAREEAAQKAYSQFRDLKTAYEGRWEFWRSVMTYVGVGLAVAIIVGFSVWLLIWLDWRGHAYSNQQAWVCAQGRDAACAQVIERYREDLDGANTLDEYRTAQRRIALYQNLYTQRTGHALSLPDNPDTHP